jgi:hypothetical protein
MDEFSWFVGFFEGEGSFVIHKETHAKGLGAESTDLDVLERVQCEVGGSIYKISRRDSQPHWKQSWKWQLTGIDAFELATKMKPFLSIRRQQRCIDFLDMYQATLLRREKYELTKRQIVSLRNDGFSLREIGKQLGLDHGYVGRVIKKNSI